MEQWEHFVTTLVADAKNAEDYLRSNWPTQKFPKYFPASLIPQLDVFGRQGWELVTAQPVTMGENGDVVYDNLGLTHTYLCFFKRRIGGEER